MLCTSSLPSFVNLWMTCLWSSTIQTCFSGSYGLIATKCGRCNMESHWVQASMTSPSPLSTRMQCSSAHRYRYGRRWPPRRRYPPQPEFRRRRFSAGSTRSRRAMENTRSESRRSGPHRKSVVAPAARHSATRRAGAHRYGPDSPQTRSIPHPRSNPRAPAGSSDLSASRPRHHRVR